MVKPLTSAGLAVLIVIVVGVVLLAPVSSAIPASGLDLQEVELTATPPALAADETAQPVETSQPQGTPPATQGSDHGSVMFVENAGQWDEGARFQVWGGPAGTMWLAEDAIWITVLEPGETSRQVDEAADPGLLQLPDVRVNPSPSHGVNIKLSFVGANPQPRIETYDRVETAVSYFLGNDPNQWRPEVAVWGGVRYVDLYPGVDLEFTGENGQMTPRLAVRSGANLGAVRLRVEGVDAVTADGDVLRLSMVAGEVIWPLLKVDGIKVGGVWAEPTGIQTFDVAVPLVRANSRRLAASDNQRSLSDNPADLLYGTFLGGSVQDWGNAIAVDGAGSAYVTGNTESNNFPTTPGVFDPSYNGIYNDAFVIKLNPAGSGLAYATFLGGSGSEAGLAVVVLGTGSAFVSGQTNSSNFPTTPGAFDRSYNDSDCFDAFVVKLNPAGRGLTYASFLGGSNCDDGRGIAVDGAGNAYLTGNTQSRNFPTTPGAFDTSYNGGSEVYVAKLNAVGTELAYATLLGGGSYKSGNAIKVDGTGSAYVVGYTSSGNFPTTPGAFDTSFNGGEYGDAFVAKLNPSGSGLIYATFLGGSGQDWGKAIAIDGVGSAYVTGDTHSTNFPTTPGAFDRSYNGGSFYGDAFVAKLNSTGSGLAYATFLGGSGADQGLSIMVNGTGNAYVGGLTVSNNFPTTPGAFDTSYSGGDAFVVKLNLTGSGLAYATFLGGSSDDQCLAIVAGAADSAYVTGVTVSSNFPTTSGAFDRSFNGSVDAFVARLTVRGSTAPPTPTATPTRSPTPTPTPTRTATPMPAREYLPLILHRWPPIPYAPVLNTIMAPGANPTYTITWSEVSSSSYVLERATSASFADTAQVYTGAATAYTARSQGIARYYYRVKARNPWGDSPWSNVQSVEVRWEQEPNYPVSLANGPLGSGLNYYGYPNDNNDYFTFRTASHGQITVDLSNHTGQGVQVVLYYPAGHEVARDYQPPYHLVYTGDPGTYYVQIYTETGFNTTTPYTLRAVFP